MDLFLHLDDFHFLRPHFLWLFVPWIIIASVITTRQKKRRAEHLFAPHLLKHLIQKPQQHSTQWLPKVCLGLLAMCLTLSAAGPTWSRQPMPWLKDQSAVVLLVKLTPSMLAKDVQPSRLERMKQKLKVFVNKRSGQKHALMVYAGSAHVVMPFSSDPDAITYFSDALQLDIMPTEGDAPDKAFNAANALLDQSGLPGSIVWMTDDLTLNDELDIPYPIHSYLFTLKKDNTQFQPSITQVTPDDTDIAELLDSVKHHWSLPSGSEDTAQWEDQGYHLVPVILLLLLAWFIPGWVVSYEN